MVIFSDMARHQRLTVGVFNIERFGYDRGQGNHRLPAALEWMLDQTPVPPDVLAFPEATNGLADWQRPIRRIAVNTLSRKLDGGWYEPLFSSRTLPGRGNHLHLLLVNTAKVHPLGWSEPEAPGVGRRHAGFAQCEIFGHEVMLCCEHWAGGDGREEFDRAANRVAQKGNLRKTLLLGDFNSDSGWPGERHITEQLNWYEQCRAQGNLDKLLQKGWFNPAAVHPATGEPGWFYPALRSGDRGWWQVDTRQLDLLRRFFGFLDMGEEAGDPTVTTNPRTGSGSRIDRVLRSAGFPARVLEYAVRQPPREISDHGYVFGTYLVEESDPAG